MVISADAITIAYVIVLFDYIEIKHNGCHISDVTMCRHAHICHIECLSKFATLKGYITLSYQNTFV